MQTHRSCLHRATACVVLTLGLCAFAQASHADTLGNPLTDDYSQGNDGAAALTIFDVGGSSNPFAIPSAGTITSGTIHSGNNGGSGTGSPFSLLLLEQVSTSDGATTYQVLDEASSSGTGLDQNITIPGLDWNVTSNDVLAYWGYAAAYNGATVDTAGAGTFVTSTGSYGAPDPGNGTEFTVEPNGTADASYAYSTAYREYAVQFDFAASAPEPSSLAMLAVGGLLLVGAYRFRSRQA